MPPNTPKRFTESVSAMVTVEQFALLNELADGEQVSRSDVLRDVIRIGLPFVEKEYRRRAAQRGIDSLREEVPV